jgi:hypothetical protein
MKLCLTFLLFISFLTKGLSQNCEIDFSEDKFTKDKKDYFDLDGYEGNSSIKPFVRLTIHVSGSESYQNNNLRIELSAGTGKRDELLNNDRWRDYSSLTLQYVGQKENTLLLYFLFEDGKSLYLMGSSEVVYGNSVYMVKSVQQEILQYFKTKKVTDIRFIYNSVQGDYHLPDSRQDYFKQLMTCLNW